MFKTRIKTTVYSDDPKNSLVEEEVSATNDGCSTFLVIVIVIAVAVAIFIISHDEGYSSGNVTVCDQNIWGTYVCK